MNSLTHGLLSNKLHSFLSCFHYLSFSYLPFLPLSCLASTRLPPKCISFQHRLSVSQEPLLPDLPVLQSSQEWHVFPIGSLMGADHTASNQRPRWVSYRSVVYRPRHEVKLQGSIQPYGLSSWLQCEEESGASREPCIQRYTFILCWGAPYNTFPIPPHIDNVNV